MTKNENPKMPEINRKLFNNKNYPLLTIIITTKLQKNYQFGTEVPFWLEEQPKLPLSFIARITLITLGKDV